MSVSSSASQIPSTQTSNPGEKTISEKLARKRVLDRKAQQAARSRTKWTIENLQYQVAQLNEALIQETSRWQYLVQESKDELALVQQENHDLRLQLQDAMCKSSGPSANLSDSGTSPAIADTWEDDMTDPTRHNSASQSPGITPIIFEPYESLPWNTDPTCVSDRILQSYAEMARMRVHATSDIFLEERPDMSALLARYRTADPPGVSNVVSDILLAYSEINTLPKKAACLYVMYKLLNVSIAIYVM